MELVTSRTDLGDATVESPTSGGVISDTVTLPASTGATRTRHWQVLSRIGPGQPAADGGSDRQPAGSCSSNRSGYSPEHDSDALERPAPDGGWGWVVVAAAFTINMIADGVCFSFGVFFIEFLRYFGASKSATSWLGSVFLALPLLLGPVASSLVDKFGCRNTTIIGALLSAAGFVLSYFVNSLELLFLTFSIMPGVGLSFCYVTAVVIVAYYFERRRTLATGISVCGTGVGTFLFPPLVEHLIQEYGWRGTLLILSGFFLNMIVCGMLMRDLNWGKQDRERTSQCTLSGDGDLESLESEQCRLRRNMRSDGAGAPASWRDAATRCRTKTSGQEQRRLHSSALLLPTWASDNDVIAEVRTRAESRLATYHRLATGRQAQGPPDGGVATAAEDTPREADTGPACDGPRDVEHVTCDGPRGVEHVTCDRRSDTRNGDVVCSAVAQRELCVSPGGGGAALVAGDATCSAADGGQVSPRTGQCARGVSGAVRHQTAAVLSPSCCLQPPASPPVRRRGLARHSLSESYQSYQPPADLLAPTALLRKPSFNRDSMTYRGAMLHIRRYRPRATSCPDLGPGAAPATVCRPRSQGCCYCLAEVAEPLQKMADTTFFQLPAFSLFALSNLVLYMVYDVPYVYFADHALTKGADEERASALISVIGCTNVMGVLVIGYLGDQPGVDITALYVACMLGCGFVVLLVPSCDSYWLLVAISAVFGFCISANYALAPTMLVELITIDNFTSAYGQLLLVQGVANLIGPPLCGMMFDRTGSYDLTFVSAGAGMLASGLMLLLLLLRRPCRRARPTAASDATLAGQQDAAQPLSGERPTHL